MGFWTLFEVASMPMLQVLLISALGAFMATHYCNLLPATTRNSLNKIVFIVFTPSLMFASLAKTVTLQDIISWWFMPINIGLTFLFGGILGWMLVKLIKPKPYLHGLVIATCASGNLGSLMLIIVPAVCNEAGSPFGDSDKCSSVGLSYSSFSMALGGFYIWTYTYHLIRSSAKLKEFKDDEEIPIEASKDLEEATLQTHLLGKSKNQEHESSSAKTADYTENQVIVPQDLGGQLINEQVPLRSKIVQVLHTLVEELLAPPTIAAIIGFCFGAVTWLRNLIIGDTAPLRVIQDSVQLLGDGTIPCITLILGGNLTQGLRSSKIRPLIIVGVVCVRYIVLPAIGIWVVKGAAQLGLLPSDPLFHYMLMLQFTLPPAMGISTMTQLFDVAEEECSVLFLWTYLVAALALTAWSTVYMWILS